MKIPCLVVLIAASATALAQATGVNGDTQKVMIVGVTHDDSVMGGGIGSGRAMKPGKAGVAPIAWLTSAGNWLKQPCDVGNTPYNYSGYSKQCHRFEHDYLDHPHTYTVVSADGRGTPVQVARFDLDQECIGIGGSGTFPGSAIRYAGVAAESEEGFDSGDPARRSNGDESAAIRKSFAAVMGQKLDSTDELNVYSVTLEGQSLIAIQRAFQDYANKYKDPALPPQRDLIFAIGRLERGRFRLLYWKENTSDENEQILGLIHLKTGRDFLVNTISHPEGSFFRVYGIRNGKLAVVFEGGGGGC